MRNRELNANDLQSILYWYSKAFNDNEDDDVEVYQKTLIKIQALAVYAQEDEEWSGQILQKEIEMKILDLEHLEAQFGLMIREKKNPDNYALIRFEDLDKVIEYYNSFKKKFKQNSNKTDWRETGEW